MFFKSGGVCVVKRVLLLPFILGIHRRTACVKT